MCRAFANCKDSLLPGTCKSISFLKTHFSKQFFKKAILDIAVAIIIPLHESAGNQLHPIGYQDQPHWHVWAQILNYAGTPTVSVVHEDLSLPMVPNIAITLRGPGTGKGHICTMTLHPLYCQASGPGPWDPGEAPYHMSGWVRACVLALAMVSSAFLGFFMAFSMMFNLVLSRDCNEIFGVNLWTSFLSQSILSFVKVVQNPCQTYVMLFWNSLYQSWKQLHWTSSLFSLWTPRHTKM